MFKPTNCMNCGAPLSIEPGQKKVFCSHCGTEHFSEDAGNGPNFVIRGGVLHRYIGESTHVVVPETVKHIAEGAFAECIIDELILPDSLETLDDIWSNEDDKFADCRFTHLTMPKRLKFFPGIKDLENLKSLTFNEIAFIDFYEVDYGYTIRIFDHLKEAHFQELSHLRNLLVKRYGFNISQISEAIRQGKIFHYDVFPNDCRIFIKENEVTKDNIFDYATSASICFLAFLNLNFAWTTILPAFEKKIELYPGFLNDVAYFKREKAQKEEQEKQEQQRRAQINNGICPDCGNKLKRLNFFNRKGKIGDAYCKNCQQSFFQYD